MTKQSKHVAPYPPEFRAEAIQLARTSGKPHAQIARELGMTGETLRLWLKQADLDEGKRSDGLTSEEQEELRRLRRENRILREEREILKKAAAFFVPLRRRPARSGESLRVRGAREGHPSRRDASAVCWASPPAAIGPGASVTSRRVRRADARVDRADSRDSPGESWDVRRPADPGRTWCSRGRGVDASASRASCGSAGLVGCHRRRPFHTTQRDPAGGAGARLGPAARLWPARRTSSGSPISPMCRHGERDSSIWP